MDDLLNEFLTETVEILDVIDVELVQCEQKTTNEQILINYFRLVHTIKGHMRLPVAHPEIADLLNLCRRIVTAIDKRRRLSLPIRERNENFWQ